jgi:hypothetical protein
MAHVADGETAAPDAGASMWREMTWSEYYDSVMKNAKRRGASVIWINPPEVRTVERTKQPTPTSPAASRRVER